MGRGGGGVRPGNGDWSGEEGVILSFVLGIILFLGVFDGLRNFVVCARTVYAAKSAGCLVVGGGGGRELGGDGDIDLVVMGIKEAVL